MILRRKKLDSEGAALVEFALVMPVFFAMFLGILEFCFMLYNRSAIETVTHQVLRTAQVRTVGQNSGVRNNNLSNLLRERISSVVLTGFDANNLTFFTRVYEDFDSRDSGWECDGNRRISGNVCIGQFGNSRITEMTITYKHEFMTPLAIFANGMDDSVDIVSTGFVKMERPS